MAQSASEFDRNRQLALPQSQERVFLQSILNLENIEKIKSSMTMNKKEITTDSLIEYLNLAGWNIDPEKIELVARKAENIYNRYSDYRTNSEEYIFIAESMSEFEGLRLSEQMYGGESFAISIHDMIRIIKEGVEDENVLHSCIRKDSVYLISVIKSLETNSLGSMLPQSIYGFYKCNNKHSSVFKIQK